MVPIDHLQTRSVTDNSPVGLIRQTTGHMACSLRSGLGRGTIVRWRWLVAIPAGTALALSVLTTLAPAAFATSSDSTGSDNAATAPAPAQPDGPMPSVDELEAQ